MRISLQTVRVAVLLACGALLASAGPDDEGGLVTIILSQSNSFHSRRAREKQRLWMADLDTRNISLSRVLLSHELSDHRGGWTMVPLFPLLLTDFGKACWYLFVTEETEVDFERLENVLKRHDCRKELFLGHALQDQGRTIIHHYISPEVHYPNLPSGWAVSRPALHKLVEHIDSFNPDFNIDPQFELAVFMRYLSTPELEEFFPNPPPPSEGGILLTHVPEFCITFKKEGICATSYTQSIPDCGPSVSLSEIFFAVKTCEKFHSARLPVVLQTWGRDADGSIAYYSDLADPNYSTIDIGVPNTESGHCGKTFAIIHKLHTDPELGNKQWLVIADDDTLLSVSRLRRLLACYDPDQSILLGEVYGYRAHHPRGTSYVTGGGGMVLSRAAVKAIADSGQLCPYPDYPDDMYLGTIARDLEIDIVHSPLFHQSQPESFHPSILKLQTAVSFHRHRPHDPYTVYRAYLTDRLEGREAPSSEKQEMQNAKNEL